MNDINISELKIKVTDDNNKEYELIAETDNNGNVVNYKTYKQANTSELSNNLQVDFKPIIRQGGTNPQDESYLKRVKNNESTEYSDIDYIKTGKVWHILSINSDTNTISITTNEPTKGKIYISGYNGYSNAPTYLDNICRYYYGLYDIANPNDVRSMKYEDNANYIAAGLTTNVEFWLATNNYRYAGGNIYETSFVESNGSWEGKQHLWDSGSYSAPAAYSLRPVVTISMNHVFWNNDSHEYIIIK